MVSTGQKLFQSFFFSKLFKICCSQILERLEKIMHFEQRRTFFLLVTKYFLQKPNLFANYFHDWFHWKKYQCWIHWKNLKKLFSADFIAKSSEKKKFRAEFNFFLTKKKIDFLPLIIFSKNASFFPEYALEIWEQKVTKFCSCSKKSVTFCRRRRIGSSLWSSKFFVHFCRPNTRALHSGRNFGPTTLRCFGLGLASLGKTFI